MGGGGVRGKAKGRPGCGEGGSGVGGGGGVSGDGGVRFGEMADALGTEVTMTVGNNSWDLVE